LGAVVFTLKATGVLCAFVSFSVLLGDDCVGVFVKVKVVSGSSWSSVIVGGGGMVMPAYAAPQLGEG